jgi:MinD superfamily P-loop ATPase
MKAAIASGKGGTGKTSVTASLAAIWDSPVVAVDLDVEAPNLHIFLQPRIEGRAPAYLVVPEVDLQRCNRCRACAEICQFKAISVLGDVVLTFAEMCHGCGACQAVCPTQAISPGRRELGEISWGLAGDVGFLMGRLRVGEAMSPPLMRQVQARLAAMTADGRDVLIDAPPGVSCPAVTAVMAADAIVLVTEPTPFGAYDLDLARQAFAPLGKPMGVVVNRAGLGDERVYGLCARHGLPILAEIPYERAIAEAYSRGEVIARTGPRQEALFRNLAGRVCRLAEQRMPCAEGRHA